MQQNLARERVDGIANEGRRGRVFSFAAAVFAHGTFIRVRRAVRAVVVAYPARSFVRSSGFITWWSSLLGPATTQSGRTHSSSGAGDNRAVIHAWAGVTSEGGVPSPRLPTLLHTAHADKPRQKGVAACGCSTGENMPKITCNSLILAVQA